MFINKTVYINRIYGIRLNKTNKIFRNKSKNAKNF